MALPVGTQFRYWGIALVVLAVVFWYLGNVLLPFVIGGAIAYFIDPIADRLERWGLSRTAATALITVLGILLFVTVFLLVVPTLITQTTELIQIAPQIFRDARDFLTERYPDLLEPDSTLRNALATVDETLKNAATTIAGAALGSAMSFVNMLMLVVIVPVVSVYLLLDWDRMIANIDELLPRDHAPVVRQLASEIDRTLSSFVRGMGTVCLILGIYYAGALMLVGLQFGLVVGFVAGMVTFIPYLGALIGGVLAIGLALFQFWGEWTQVGLVAGIFIVGQVVEGNFLTPRLVGNSVGLHPVWLLLALSVFGALFGFVGLLIAVPVTAALGVLARFGVRQYLQSKLYTGLSGPDVD
ncbi:AI-2E family transporter [Chachezhania antarctica]|uniref:AI-2E family transporter n=1 Tax=Chachezhania antarctica TaxID=2340860 RepID=UPI000EAFBEF3|nr:AI-2E family transporter [Chachezhania antarctica]|tara:strand:- start:119 stop:1186 length:1068 start_codon:yes stop_codon:yes gene_type:complete